jgi:hypothetical protein
MQLCRMTWVYFLRLAVWMDSICCMERIQIR